VGASVSLGQDAVHIRAEQLNRACFSILSASLGLVLTLLPPLDPALVLPAVRLPLIFDDDQGQPRNEVKYTGCTSPHLAECPVKA